MSPIEYNQEMQGYGNTIKNSIAEEGIRLPFPNALIYWNNGKAQNKHASDITYFGGWAVSADNMDELIAQLGIGVHSSFTKTSLVSNDGNEYDAYISRNITVAVCAKRIQWVENEITHIKSSRMQILALAAELSQDKKTFSTWAPVVLSAKGYSCKFINDALAQWDTATAATRREFAQDMPSQFFWAVIGTFGKDPIFESVGKKQKNIITPCKCWLPSEFNDAIVTRHFVGNDNMKRMAELATLSEEWRKAWTDKAGEKPGTPDNFAGQPETELVDDLIPF